MGREEPLCVFWSARHELGIKGVGPLARDRLG